MAEKHSDSGNDNEKLLDKFNNTPTKCLPMSSNRGLISAYKNDLLYCSKDNIHLFDEQAEERVKMTFGFDIDNICWSSALNQFLVLSNNQLHALNLDTKEVKLVKTFDNVWSQFTVHEDTLIVSIDKYGANMEVYNLRKWKLLKKFKSPVSVKENQRITQLQFNSSGTKLAVAVADRDQLFFQLRNPKDMNVLHTVDLTYFKGCTSYHMFPLSNDEFLVNPDLENHISLIDSNGKVKKNMPYNADIGGIVSAALITNDKKYLVLNVGILVETQMDDYYKYELHFFDLQ